MFSSSTSFDTSSQRIINSYGQVALKKRTLTNLYNARPTWLANAHARLDRAVYAAYGWPPETTDEDVLKNLLALNLERSERGAPLIHPNA
jgi:hypothetical protein